MALFTMPDINADEAPDIAAYPENSQSRVDGVQVRWPDGVHITRARGRWLQSINLSTVGQLGLTAQASRGI